MSDWIDQFIFFDELDERARLELESSLKQRGDASVAAAFEEWKLLRTSLREQFGGEVRDRRSLIHFAMWRHGHASYLTEQELAEVEAMLPHYEDAMRRSEALRDIVRRIGREQDDFVDTWRLHAGGEEAASRSSSASSIQRRRANERLTNVVWRAAVVFVVVASSVALYMGLGVDSKTVLVKSDLDGVESVVLDDGTLVRLVSGAELRYEQPTGERPFDRQVSLNGRALFRVTPGDRQFVVETPAAITTVWGTTFGLDSDGSFTEVVVADGRVSVVSRRDSQRPVILKQGEMTRVVGARKPTAPVRVNITDALSFTRLFVFRNETTFMIANKLTDHFEVPITVHPDLARETVTGTFERNWSLEYILQTVARTLDGQVAGSEIEGYKLIPLESGRR